MATYTYYRWTKIDSPNLKLWRENPQKIQYLWSGKESRKAFWVFSKKSDYKASASIQKNRTLVAFDFTEEGDTIIRHLDNAVYFGYGNDKTPVMIGETSHPDGVIWKSNESDAFGIGTVVRQLLSTRLLKPGIRQATKEETRWALGKGKRDDVPWKKWPKLK